MSDGALKLLMRDAEVHDAIVPGRRCGVGLQREIPYTSLQ